MSGCCPFDSDLEWIVTICVLILLSVCDVLMRESVVCEFSGFSLQVCANGILCVFVRDSGSFLCVVQVSYL